MIGVTFGGTRHHRTFYLAVTHHQRGEGGRKAALAGVAEERWRRLEGLGRTGVGVEQDRGKRKKQSIARSKRERKNSWLKYTK